MAAKPNIRSFRFSDEIAGILEQQPGESLNAKFENLVKTCFQAIPQKQEQLAQLDKQITERRQLLQKLERATAALAVLERDLQSIRYSLDGVKHRAESLDTSLRDM